jgi:hypothetical protein
VPDLVRDLVSQVLKVFSGPLSLRTYGVEMLVELSPRFFSSLARRSSMRCGRPDRDLLFLRETAAQQIL